MTEAKIFVSSTFQDLEEYRDAVCRQIRKAGFLDVAMEYYTAEAARPIDRCLEDVRNCDVYLGIFAFRYGHVPESELNPDRLSITELEYREAVLAGKTCLIFVTREGCSWPTNYIDSLTGDNDHGARIRALRRELSGNGIWGEFEDPNELAAEVSVALLKWSAARGEAPEGHRAAGTPGPSLPSNVASYLEGVLEEFSYIDSHYLGLEGIARRRRDAPSPAVARSHVPAALQASIHDRYSKAEDEVLPLDPVDSALDRYRSFVVLGNPGSGKSTLLHHFCHRTAREALARESDRVPLYMDLRDWPRSIESTEDLVAYLSRTNQLPELDPARWLLVLDGLNEVGSERLPAIFARLKKWIQPGNRSSLIVSCRKLDYFGTEQFDLPSVEIKPMSDGRIVEFVRKTLGETDGQALLEAMGWMTRADPQLRQMMAMARNPYELVAICEIFRQQRVVVQKRAELHALLVELLYDRERDRGSTFGLSFDEMLENFGRIALELYRGHHSTMAHVPWAAKRVDDEVSPDALWKLGHATGVIRMRKHGRFFEFSHEKRQEYFAGRYLLGEPDLVASYLDPSRFRDGHRLANRTDEMLLMLLELGDAPVLLRELLDIDPYLGLDLCGRLEEAGGAVTRELVSRDVVRALIRDLGSDDADSRDAARVALMGLGEVGISHLAALLPECNPKERRDVVDALGTVPLTSAVGVLLHASTLPGKANKWVRKSAEQSLLAIADDRPDLLRAFVDNLHDSKNATERHRIGRQLLDLLLEDDFEFCEYVANVVGTDDLKERIEEARPAAVEVETPPEPTPALEAEPAAPPSDRVDELISQVALAGFKQSNDYLDRLVEMGPEVVPDVIEAMENGSHRLRRRLPRVLGRLRALEAVNPLLRLLTDHTGVVRTHAIRALGMIGASRAIPAIAAHFDDPDPQVRMHCAIALAALKATDEIPTLRRLLTDRSAEVRIAALMGLDRISGGESLVLALAGLTDENQNYRVSCLKILGERGTESHRLPVEALLEDPSPHVRGQALRVLRTIGTPDSIPVVLRCLEDEDDQVRGASIQTLAFLGEEGATARAKAALEDEQPFIRGAGLVALARLLGPAALPYAKKALDETAISPRRCALGIIRDIARDGQTIDDELVERVCRLAYAGGVIVRVDAIEALEAIGSERCLRQLRELRDDPSDKVREAAGEALDRLYVEERETEAG